MSLVFHWATVTGPWPFRLHGFGSPYGLCTEIQASTACTASPYGDVLQVFISYTSAYSPVSRTGDGLAVIPSIWMACGSPLDRSHVESSTYRTVSAIDQYAAIFHSSNGPAAFRQSLKLLTTQVIDRQIPVNPLIQCCLLVINPPVASSTTSSY